MSKNIPSARSNKMCKSKRIDISVIVPVYNCEKYLDECLKSIESQYYDRGAIKVIAIDDGSTDNSLKIIKEYCKKHKDWQYISQKNQGLSMARNNGLKEIKTEYVIFFDGDDILPSTSISDLVRAITHNNADIAIGGLENFNSQGHFRSYAKKYLRNIDGVSYKEYPDLLNLIYSTGKIYKYSSIKNLHFIPDVIHEDNFFTLSLYLSSKKINMIDKVVYYRRCREEKGNESITQSLNLKTFKDLLINFDEVLKRKTTDYIIAKTLIRKTYSYILKNVPNSQKQPALQMARRFSGSCIDKCNCEPIQKHMLKNQHNLLLLSVTTISQIAKLKPAKATS